ncbi:guanylate cyclase 32E-like [Portunus trituberculatus]|uniref:guanylate cyclase 32E-like n=1 Tax=Portunus trituberculatus TaxID=210409 RepID=UPI001E1CBC73|nr:guanylate cyclase 32E-like [Portunus trituberculatus]
MMLARLAMWVALLHAYAAHTTHSTHNHQAHGRTFTLGYLTGSDRLPEDQEYKRPGLLISGAITLAVEEVNNVFPLVQGHRLNFTVAETYGREEKSILNTARLWISNISAYIGPQETCVHEARMASAFNLPMISYFCTHPETSDKTHFPTFARTRPPDTQISKSVTSVLKRFNWRKVTFFYNNSPDDNFARVAQTIERTLPLHNITVTATKTWAATYHHGYDNNPFKTMIQETYMDSRIYVVLGHYYEFLGLMTIMEERGLFRKGEYFVVGVTLSQYDKNKPDKYLRDLLNEDTNSIVQAAFQNFLGVVPSPAPMFNKFASNVNAFLEKPPFNHPNAVHKIGGMKNIRAEAAFLYDAVHVYARALNETLKKGSNPRNGSALVATILGTSYRSAMGYMVRMDEKGDAEGNYTLIGRQKHHSTPGEYGLYPVGGFRYSVGNYKGLPELHLTSPIPWKTGVPPIDEPPCGYRGLKCQSQTGEIIAGVTGGVVLLLLVVSLIAYRNWRYEQELDSLLWKIDYKDIKINDWTPNHIPAANKLSRGLYATIRSSQLSLNSNLDLDYASVHTQLGTLLRIRDLRHDNLLGFVGACVDPPNVCIVTEYCSRGSLKDILDNEDVKLDNMFIASLIGDIVQGMIYLHDSSVKSHGNLKSSNCLVDSRWVVKISDFGLHELKSGYETTSLAEAGETQRKCTDLLYRAPELLRDTSAPPGGTQKGDVYSFAIILYEIHVRHGPWGTTDQSPLSVIRLVMAGPQGSTFPVRPSLEAMESSLDCVRVVLTECWAEIPEERPDFRSIKIKLRPMRKGLKPNIFDNMLEMMEKYANNLEALVDERTDQLIEEKKKTEALLYEMLPPYVAEQLKRGRKVQAESFDCVTIYFSDIVGFTEMSAESTPLQVVDFLNDLYTCFDSIIGHYDVYKVETIGDAYMVVSGLPIRNEEQHAGEVASMSLHLLDAIKKFQIRHRPTDTLKLRIGLHSGPVCAGVVGLKMPRYCLFGDTVNTASRMESSGQALKIHCSVLCRNILAKVGGYILEERGQVKVKGKGEMTTYWLVGEDPEWKRRREKTRRQRGFYPARNGCVGGGGGSSMGIGGGAARGSLRCVRTPASPLPNTLSLESQKFLKFTISDELGIHCTHEVATHEASPPAPASPASDDGGTMRRPALEAKRNSYPCIKESRDGPRRSRGQSLAGPRDDCPLLAHADLAPSPGSSFAGSGEEEALATSRRTSVSEVCASRPPSMIDHGGDGPPPTPGEPPPGPSRSNKNQSESHDAAHLSPSALDLVLATPPCSNVCGRTISGGGALTKPRYNLATGGGRWLPQGRRGSSTDGDNMSGVAAGNESSDGRTARLRYCGRQEGSSTAECEESAPLLAGVANYRIINELRTPRTQPERETPV